MIPKCDFLNILNHGCKDCTTGYDKINPNVDYYTIAGNKSSIGDSDGCVYVNSLKLSGEPNYVYHVTHNELRTDHDVYQKVEDILLDKADMSHYRDPLAQQAPLISGKIYPGEEKSHEILISGTAGADFSLYWIQGDLNLTLTTPNGTLINLSVVESNPNIIHFEDTELILEGYTIENPDGGIWRVNITAVNVSDEGENYTVLTFLDTNITLALSLQKYQYDPNEPINITVNLTYGSEAITNVSVTAKIKRPDDTFKNLTLFDDGLHGDDQTNDGIYANAYTNTSSWGTYDITVTASGILNEEQFERETFATVWVERYPDLTLNASDISFSNDAPLAGENITINATIHNVGEADTTNASIMFYDAEPANDEFIGEDVVNVTTNGTVNASVSWSALSGVHHIHVLISPYNEFLEENYTNNMANKSIKVNTPPIANFTYSPLNPVVNQTITFNASSSYDPDGNITSYEWDFGDGNITNTTEETINHSYSEAGSYLVNLTVTNDDGATNSTTKEITVQPAPDTTPPASIFNLQNTTGQTWINWTWTNPPDADFNYTMVYLNGTWQTNTSYPFYNATNLTPNTVYEIGIQTSLLSLHLHR